MNFCKDEAFVIRKKKFQDFHEIIDVFTRNSGKISGVARGLRRPNRPIQYDGYIDTLSLIRIHYFERDAKSLVSVIATELEQSYLSMRADYERLLQGWVMAEMLDKGYPGRLASPEAFDLIKDMFNLLDSNTLSEVLVYYFAKQLSLWGHYPDRVFRNNAPYSSRVKDTVRSWLTDSDLNLGKGEIVAGPQALSLMDDLVMEIQNYLGNHLRTYKIYRRGKAILAASQNLVKV